VIATPPYWSLWVLVTLALAVLWLGTSAHVCRANQAELIRQQRLMLDQIEALARQQGTVEMVVPHPAEFLSDLK